MTYQEIFERIELAALRARDQWPADLTTAGRGVYKHVLNELARQMAELAKEERQRVEIEYPRKERYDDF